MGAVQAVIIAVPCFNEERRLALAEFERLLGDPRVSLLFVDDGSTDGTRRLLETCAAEHGARVEVLALPENRGKAEAVRAGLARALERGADAVGYIDADLATPVAEVLRLIDELDAAGAGAGGAIAARVAHLGADIQRSQARHYLGRVFATVASFVLDASVYDTQCGAKFFRDTPGLRAALAEPFSSRWAFDVELLGRLFGQGVSVIEVPLKEWRDVSGSKMRPRAMIRAGIDLLRIGVRLRRRRAPH